MRHGLGLRTLTCLTVACAVSIPAGAQDFSFPKPLEPLQRLGRAVGVGWGDGYHACDRDLRLPVADLPPRSYTAQHALHPHHPPQPHSPFHPHGGQRQTGRQHWEAAAQAHPMYGSYTSPNAFPSPPASMHYGHSGSPNRPQFPVPPSVLEELQNLPLETDRKLPASAEPRQDTPSAEHNTNLTQPPGSRPPASNYRSSSPPLQAEPTEPGEFANQLGSMLNELKRDRQGNAAAQTDTIAEPELPAAERLPPESLRPIQDAPQGRPLENDFGTSDLLLENPSQTAELLEADLLNELPPQETPQPADPLLDDALLPSLDNSGDLLLDDQAARRTFIREPVAGTPRRIPASERVARQRAAANR